MSIPSYLTTSERPEQETRSTLSAELDLAAKVHYSFLPSDFPNAAIDVAVKARPLTKLGGDYCSIVPVNEHCVMMCMCDAMGHGIASALFASRVNTFVLTHMIRHRDPCTLIESLNAHLCQRLSNMAMFASFFSLAMDFERQELRYAGAGHPPALHFRASKSDSRFLESVTTILGFEDPLPISCSIASHRFAAGDKIVLYTDGLIDSQDGAGERFGTKGLDRFTAQHHRLDSATFNEQLFEHAGCASGYEVRDDVLLMTVTVK